MHPVDKKNKHFTILICVLAIGITSACVIINPAYLIVIIAYIIFGIEKRKVIKNIIPLTAAYIIIGNIVILILDNFLFKFIFSEPFQAPIRFLLSLSSFFILFSIHFLKFQNLLLLKIIKNEKEHFTLISKYPDLLCRKHHTRTKQSKILGFRKINCRTSWFCFGQRRIREVKQLIGLIGKEYERWTFEKNYYVTLWNSKSGKINNGDYDVIEIHESNSIEDYNAVINKVIDFQYNEINRYEPISEVVVKIIGHPQISESTKRRLEEHFLKVEYLIPELEEVEA